MILSNLRYAKALKNQVILLNLKPESTSLTTQLLPLRVMFWLLKIGLVHFAADLFGLSAPPKDIYLLFAAEAFYLAASFILRSYQHKHWVFISLVIDSIFWLIWLHLTGGATNAFVSLMLLPIAIAAVTQPAWAPWSLTLLTTLGYSLMIYAIPEHHMNHHGMDMRSHYVGMWFNYLISALVLTMFVGFIAHKIRQKDAELSYMRESQLRQEKLLALGTSSAQMAHQLATPLASLQLLVDDLNEGEQPEIIAPEMQQALSRCQHTLDNLRHATNAIREQKQIVMPVTELVGSIKSQVLLLMPELNLETHISEAAQTSMITTDVSLIPALLSLIENGARASAENGLGHKVSFDIDQESEQLFISVTDYGKGIDKSLIKQLGHRIIEAPKGMGIALLLSHASFERLGGQLIMSSLQQGGVEARVTLPVYEK
ncbi:HAMP domain-containing histidine kinase [Shewanella maritima]|uniref:histidine kinase n=1 Tax=Shewanella maritima TaxID=2520507 RepID=A0A411PMW5_9GAMM|nr:HAMP domain-containing histidine kinase [Shewanella maritima]